MVKIFLIRHAEAEGNLYRRVQGHYDGAVTGRGLCQLEALKRRFENERIDAVYSSDLSRALATAKAVCEPHGLEPVATPRLREVRMGSWEDLPWGEIAKLDPEQLQFFMTHSPEWRSEGGESFEELSSRGLGVFWDIVSENEGKTAVIVSHGMFLRELMFSLGQSGEALAHSDNTGVSLFCYEGGELKLLYANDNSHLDDKTSTFFSQSWWRDGADDSVKTAVDYNLWYSPMDLDARGERYLEARRDAWMIAHGELKGYTDDYLLEAKRRLKENPASVVEAYVGDEPCGILELNTRRDGSDGAGCIAFYWLEEKYRRRGMGLQLLGHAISVYRRLDRGFLRLRVAEENCDAIRFYDRCGFEKSGEEEGAVGTLWVMDKPI